MKHNEIKLLNLLRETDLTYNELVDALKVSEDLFNKYLNELYLNGYDIEKKYYADGSTRLILSNELVDEKGKDGKVVPITTFSNQNEFKALVISDLHFGCAKERVDLVNNAFEYAVDEGIHTIFGCGDMIDGDPEHSAGKPRILDIQDQIDYFVREYPRDKSILTFTVLGDHEDLAARKNVINIRRAINNMRNDIIVGDYAGFEIPIKDEIIRLEHKSSDKFKNSKINIFGHAHKYKVTLNSDAYNMKERYFTILSPALSDVNQGGAAFLQLNLCFENKKIKNITLKEIGFDSNKHTKLLTESNYTLTVYPEEEQINLFKQVDDPKVLRKSPK